MALEKPVWIGLLKFSSKAPSPNPKAPKYTSSKFQLKQDLPKGTYDVAFFDWGETTEGGIPKVVIKIDNPYVPKDKKKMTSDADDDIPF